MGRTGPRKYYDQEFKVNAVRLAIEKKRPSAEIARDLGINENMLWRWKKEFSEDPEQAFPGKGRGNLNILFNFSPCLTWRMSGGRR
jgi:transposase-like protein